MRSSIITVMQMEKLLAPDGFPRESDKPFRALVGSSSI